ncbi:MAG: DsbA family protein [Minisyncoccota bacterium]
MSIMQKNPFSPNAIIISIAILVGALFVSSAIVGRGTVVNSGDSKLGAVKENTVPPTAPTPQEGKVSIANDPVLGKKDAPVTIVEFSDFECPFCKRAFTEVLPQLKKEYIETGKVKLVYKDFPLDFHANAQKEAEAAQCAFDQGGDAIYYQYHDSIFTQTKGNGTGLELTELPLIAQKLGLDQAKFQKCLDSGKNEQEVKDDMAEGEKVGVSGTPSWVIGKSNGDSIEGKLIVGAQPYAALKAVIDSALEEK